MNKNAIKSFAVWARRDLIERISIKAELYGVTENNISSVPVESVNGVVLTAVEKNQCRKLVSKVKEKGFKQVIEEVAYTWFNRLTAIRFMEVNGYLPSHVRVFTDEENRFAPQILAEAIHLDIPGLNMDKVFELKQANKTEELYKYLIITQCNALNEILPGMFQKIEDYTELLLPDNLLREGSVIEQMITLIPEEDWMDQVQIIGWLYQFYNIEPKAAVFAKNGKVTKEEIPAATQLFTPDWIVRYMVENSLGRLWVEGHPNDELKSTWKYYLDEAEQEESVKTQLETIRRGYASIKPEEIKLIDPCMGSGHILCYMFDVLVQIYEAYGYTARDAASSIVENNIYGLDIDERASQLAYFAVMMKARQYDRRFFSRGIKPNVCAIVESNSISRDAIDYFINGDEELKQNIELVLKDMRDAKEYGSIINISKIDFSLLYSRFDEIIDDVSLFKQSAIDDLFPIVKVAEVLAKKYHVVVTNPPYMALSNCSPKMVDYVKRNYASGRYDLFGVFIEQCARLLKNHGYRSMITQQSWLTLGSYEELRSKLLASHRISSMCQIGYNSFPELNSKVAQAIAFVTVKDTVSLYKGTYLDLNTQYSASYDKETAFFEEKNGNKQYYVSQEVFDHLPGRAVIFSFADEIYQAYTNVKSVNDHGLTRLGMTTADNQRFTRNWYEVDINKCIFNSSSVEDVLKSSKKWVPYNKGGQSIKWYGNMECVVNWENDGFEIRNIRDDSGRIRSTVPNTDYYFRECLTWSKISWNIAFRYRPCGSIFDVAGASYFTNHSMYHMMGFLNSKVVDYLLSRLSPTLNFEGSHIGSLPVKDEIFYNSEVGMLVEENIALCKSFYDSSETSWDYLAHPYVRYTKDLWDATGIAATLSHYYGKDVTAKSPMEICHLLWQGECHKNKFLLKTNEEKINAILIDAYGLNNEITPDVDETDLTIRTSDLSKDIRSFISYAVGCVFGRYSLNVDGIVYAGGEWDESKYLTFQADKDNVLPICDDEYFEDDIVGKFVKFVEVVYGEETLEENLKFIADALGGKGTSREVIRNYFLNDFYYDHVRQYQKRPIYWQFDSGKNNAFKCLIYMHRYQKETLARIRTDYVHEQQERYATQLELLEPTLQTAVPAERVKLSKKVEKLKTQIHEIGVYEEKIHHLADQMIEIDLDDGVKENYAKFADVLTKIK